MHLKVKETTIISFIILFVGLCWLYFAANRGFWFDELDWTLAFIHNKSVITTIKELLFYGYNLPLFYILLKPFYYFSHNPYILYLPSVLCSMLGVIILYQIGRKLYGRLYSNILFLITIISPLLFDEIAAQIRPYGLLFLLSVLTFYTYLKRLESENKKTILLFGFIITCYAYTHWFASLMIATYALTDVYLWIKKKIKFRCVISYIICGVSFLPWIVSVFLFRHISFQNYWGKKIPSIEDLIDCFSFLLGYNTLLFCIFVLVSIKIFLSFILGVKNDSKHIIDWPAQFLFSCLLILFLIWTYSLISPKSSLFVLRYFKVFLPQVLMFVSWGIWFIIQIRFNLFKFLFLDKIPFYHLRFCCLFGILFLVGYIAIADAVHFKHINDNKGHHFRDSHKISTILSQEKLSNKTLILSHQASFFYTFFNVYEATKADMAIAQELNDLSSYNKNTSIFFVSIDGNLLKEHLKRDFSSLLEYDTICIYDSKDSLLKKFIQKNFTCKNHKTSGGKQLHFIKICHRKVE